MSETCLNESEVEYFHMDGYEGVHTCRSDRKGVIEGRELFPFEQKDLFKCVSVDIHLNYKKCYVHVQNTRNKYR